MPLINDDPKVKIPIYKVTKQYVSNYIITSVDCYSFLPDCGDVKNNDGIGVRLMCITEPILVGHFITRRTYYLSEFCGHR